MQRQTRLVGIARYSFIASVFGTVLIVFFTLGILFAFSACSGNGEKHKNDNEIAGVGIPLAHKLPVTAITPNRQFLGDVVWYAVGEEELVAALLSFELEMEGGIKTYDVAEEDDDDSARYNELTVDENETGTLLADGATFQEDVCYKAVITLKPTSKWKITNVSENYFTVIGARRTTNKKGSSVVRAYYNPALVNMFMVTFDSDLAGVLGSVEANPNSFKLAENAKLLLPDPPVKPGCIFGGWFLSPSITSKSKNKSSKIEIDKKDTADSTDETECTLGMPVVGDLSLKAKWLASNGETNLLNTDKGNVSSDPADGYTITFDTAGAESAQPASIIVMPKCALGASSLPIPSKTHYTFYGWYTAENGGGSQITASTVPSANIRAYAKWVFDKYTVQFDSNGATTAAIPTSREITAETGGTVILPSVPRKTGYTFEGWYAGEAEYNEKYNVTSDLDVVARWRAL